MAEIWEYIANYNPQGFYEDNRAKMLNNDLRVQQIAAANRENALQDKIMGLKDALAGGDKSVLKALGVYEPQTTKQYIENEEEMLSLARPLAQAVLRVAPENREKVYQQMLQRLRNSNVDVSDMPINYDEEMVTFIANSDPQKIRDERLNEQLKERETIQFGRDVEKMNIQADITERLNESNHNRDIRKLQYAYDRADQKTKEQIDFITSQLREGNIDGNSALVAAGKVLGVDLTPKDKVAQLKEEFFAEGTTPERRAEIVSQIKDWSMASNLSKSTPETPAQQMQRLRNAGFTADSVQKAVMYGDASLLVPDTTPKGNISANTQGNAQYSQWLDQNPDATEEEKRNARAQFGVMNYDDQMTLNLEKINAQNQGRVDVENKRGQNAIDLENAKFGHQLTMADVKAENEQKLEKLKQKNRVGLAWINDEISKGKELRELANKKSLEEFKNSLPSEKLIELGMISKQLAEQGTPRSVPELLAEQYANALKTAELERQYKEAQMQKVLAEMPYVGMTNTMKEADKLMQENPELSYQEAFELANKNKGTNVTVNNTEQDAFAKQLGKDSAAQVKKNEEAIESSRNQLFMLNNMADSLERANDVNVYFGPGGEFVYQMKSLAQALGKNTDGLADTAIIQTGKSMLMAALRKDLMPGQLSDRDLRFLVNMMPGVEKTVEQNRAILDMYKKMHEQKIRYAQAYNDYMFNHNGDARGWNNYAQEMGIFKSPNETIFTKEELGTALPEGSTVRIEGKLFTKRGGKWTQK